VKNAKTSRPGSATRRDLIVHRGVAASSCRRWRARCPKWSCAPTTRPGRSWFGDPRARGDFANEFLDLILAVKTVGSLDEAVAHVAGTARATARHRHRERAERRGVGAPRRRGRVVSRLDAVHRRRRAGTGRRGRHLDQKLTRAVRWDPRTDVPEMGCTRKDRFDERTRSTRGARQRLDCERSAAALLLARGGARAARQHDY